MVLISFSRNWGATNNFFSHESFNFLIIFFDASNFDEVQSISKFGPIDIPQGSTIEIGTQIILLQIDGFLRGWILNITPLKIRFTRNCNSRSLSYKNVCHRAKRCISAIKTSPRDQVIFGKLPTDVYCITGFVHKV